MKIVYNFFNKLMANLLAMVKGILVAKDYQKFYIIIDCLKLTIITLTKKLTGIFIAPSLNFSGNFFILKVNLLAFFFFPVFLVLFIFFDSFLTIDYLFFFYTDEADFDDFIAMIYMILFVFLMWADYDFNDDHTSNVYDYVESFTEKILHNHINNPSVYYDRNYFSMLLNISSNSLKTINNLSLLNNFQLQLNHRLLSELPVDSYILDDSMALSSSAESDFSFLKLVTIDEHLFDDSADIFVYSLYLILFDLELSRLFLFINNVLTQ